MDKINFSHSPNRSSVFIGDQSFGQRSADSRDADHQFRIIPIRDGAAGLIIARVIADPRDVPLARDVAVVRVKSIHRADTWHLSFIEIHYPSTILNPVFQPFQPFVLPPSPFPSIYRFSLN